MCSYTLQTFESTYAQMYLPLNARPGNIIYSKCNGRQTIFGVRCNFSLWLVFILFKAHVLLQKIWNISWLQLTLIATYLILAISFHYKQLSSIANTFSNFCYHWQFHQTIYFSLEACNLLCINLPLTSICN